MLILPSAIIFGVLYLIPLASLFITSFYRYVPGGQGGGMEYAFTTENYVRFFRSVYIDNTISTLSMSLTATFLSVVLAYPIAHFIVRSTGRMKKVLLSMIIISFLLSTIVRVYALVLSLSDVGVVNVVLHDLGFQGVKILNTELAVIIGLTHYCIPVAVLTLIGPIQNIDVSLEEAASSLGATNIHSFLRVTFPLSIPGIAAAIMLCYSLNVSAFVIPMVLGGGIVEMMANMIYDRYIEVVNYPFGSTMSVMLLIISVGIAYGINKAWSSRIRV